MTTSGVDDTITTQGAASLAGAFQNPAVLGALQNRLGQLVGRPSGYVDSLPDEVKQRIDALKNLQDKNNEIELKFRKEVIELEKKYLKLHEPIYQKRQEIIAGKYEPTSAECVRKDAEVKEELESDKEPKEKVSGIPYFWLTCLKNIQEVSDLITEDDEKALESLVDIQLSYLEKNDGFKLDFIFSENEFFTNSVLTKTYYMTEFPHPEYGDVVFDHAEGSVINWTNDLSQKIEVKKQRHKSTNKTRTVKKTVPKETFFSFFMPPTPKPLEAEPGNASSEEDEDNVEEVDEAVEADYEIGEIIKEKLIPNAIDWFTGKAIEYDSEEEFDDDYYGEDSEPEDEAPPPGSTPECKQQ